MDLMRCKNFTVRRLTIPELPVLSELFRYKDVARMIRETTEFMEQGMEDIFVLYRERELLGEIHISYCSTDEREAVRGRRAYLYAYRVKKGYHNKGLGSFLMRRVLCELEKEGYTEFTIGVEDDNENAKHIYEKFGFREIIARKEGRDDEESEPYEYNLLLRRKPVCRDFIFVTGPSGVGKSTLCRGLYQHYRTAYMEQNHAPEFESMDGEGNVTGIEEEEACWKWFVSSLKCYHEMGFRNIIGCDMDDLRTRDIPEDFRGYDFIILRLVCSDDRQNYEQMKNRGEGLIDFELLEKMSEKIGKRPTMVNEYVIDVAGKTPTEVCGEAVKLIDTAKTCREYEYEKQPREMFYSWVFANELR